ncbi:MAG: CDP-alcohol phosphatidyltransferase family protein [Thermoplasmata archaeon]
MTDRWRAAANAATLGNLLLGVGAIAYIVLANPIFAMLLIALGVAFDGMDGLLARRSRSPGGPFGRIADSVADAVTFGIAPAFLVGWHAGQGSPWATIGFATFALAGAVAVLAIARLSYFTVRGFQHHDFVGVPTPQTALAIVLFSLWWYLPGFLGVAPLPFLLAVGLVALAMVIPVMYPKIRRGSALRPVMAFTAIVAALALVPIQFRPDAGSPLYLFASGMSYAMAAGLFLYYFLGPFTVKRSSGPSPKA